MIDIHCHFLPGIDDGPDTMDLSLAMARRAVDNGITHSVLTPHIHPGRYENTAASIRAACVDFRQALFDHDIPLQVGFAGEVRLSSEILSLVAEDDLPFYGELKGYRILLLELPHSHVPPGSDKLVRWLLDRKIRPLIAHPERNKGIMGNIENIKPFIEMDCLFQMTAGSIAGQFGEPVLRCSQRLLEMSCITVLASDAHNLAYRPPQLDQGRDAAAEIVGHELAQQMVFDKPMAIVQSQFPSMDNHQRTNVWDG